MVLIDRDEALRRLRKRREDFTSAWRTKEAMPYAARCQYEENLDCVLIISDQSAVDAVPVVRGCWESVSPYMLMYRCSICSEVTLFSRGKRITSNYCPNCGAKMDGEK